MINATVSKVTTYQWSSNHLLFPYWKSTSAAHSSWDQAVKQFLFPILSDSQESRYIATKQIVCRNNKVSQTLVHTLNRSSDVLV